MASILGIAVPGDLSVIGYGDIEMSAWPKYNLTTIRQSIEAMVDATVEVLLDAIRNPDREQPLRLVPVQLIERGSARLNSRLGTAPIPLIRNACI